MFVIVVGAGKVGTYLARALLAKDHEIVVIEKMARKAQLMANVLETDVTMIGDGCDPLVLEQAGVRRADVVVADTGDDEDNLVVCLIAKKHSKARCIARVNNPKNKAIFESIDRDAPITLISSTEIILAAIDEHLGARDEAIIAKLKDGDLQLVRLGIGPGAPADGRRVVELALPRSSILVAIDRPGEELLIPGGDTLLQSGDVVIVLVKNDARAELQAALSGPPVPA
ncbi:MAG: potassium channel family protein [Vulcanimicrobiaceae bacterium]